MLLRDYRIVRQTRDGGRQAVGERTRVPAQQLRSYFSRMEDALSLDGDVRTTLVGADYSRGALTLGVSVGRTVGLGGYSGPSGGRMSTSMTGVLPVGGLSGQRPGVGLGGTGYGTGALSLTPDGASALETGACRWGCRPSGPGAS